MNSKTAFITLTNNQLAKCQDLKLLLELARKYQVKQKYNLAIMLYLKSYELSIQQNNLPQKCEILFNLGQIYKTQKLLTKALNCFSQSLDLSLTFNSGRLIATTFSHIGEIFLDLGLYGQGFECFQNSLLVTSNSPSKIVYLGYKALALYYLGEYNEALEIYNEAINLAQTYQRHKLQGIIFGNIGNIYFEQKAYKKAQKNYKLAYKYDSNNRNLWLANIALINLELNNYRQALKLAKFCLGQANNSIFLKAAIYDTIGQCYTKQNKYQLAVKYFTKAVYYSNKAQDNFGQRIYLSNLGNEYSKLNESKKAYKILQKASKIYELQRSKIRSDNLKIAFSSRGNDIYKNLIKLCLQENKRVEAIEYIEKSKSRALLDLLVNTPIDISSLGEDDEAIKKLVEQEKLLRSKISFLEKIYSQAISTNDNLRTGSNKLVRVSHDRKTLTKKWKHTVQLLHSLHPNYASMISQSSIKCQDIKKLWPKQIKSNSAIIEYYLENDLFTISLMHSSLSDPEIILEIDTKIIEKIYSDIANYISILHTPEFSIPKTLSKRLYNCLMAPVINQLPDYISHLIIIPHKELFNLPYAALINQENRFLCEDFSLSLMPSISIIDILSKNKLEAVEQSYLISAISDYSATRDSNITISYPNRNNLNDLLYTIEEANTLLASNPLLKENSLVLIDNEVQENFEASFSHHSIIHFAGHAYFDSNDPLSSGLILSDGSIITAANILINEKLKTGIGKLLVLSACQTGINKLTQGSEILGLTRAFMYSGMKNMILALWEVSDNSTAIFMGEFYKYLHESKFNIAKSLQMAQVQFLKSGRSVNTWAPFIHFGLD